LYWSPNEGLESNQRQEHNPIGELERWTTISLSIHPREQYTTHPINHDMTGLCN